jgi:TniQ
MSERWPLHPPPYPHESLSSWLERQASCYGYHCRDLLAYDLGFPALSPEQLDTDPPALLLERLAERSGISAEQLGTMTIQGWVLQLIDSLKPNAGSYPMYVREHALLYPTELRRYQEFHDWVPWMSADHFSGRVACRLCLRDGPEPYRRLSWRMAWMTSCPVHGILLEERVVVAGQILYEAVDEPVPAPKEILTIDRFTRQAIEEGMVSLPRDLVPGGTWLRMLRTLLDELSLPAAPLKQYRPTVSTIWSTLGLGIRQGMRSATIPFEMLDSERRLLLMRVVGVAVELLMKGELKRAGKDAFLFVASPRDHENRPAPLQLLSSESTSLELSSYEQAWRKVHTVMEDVEVAMRHDLQTAIQMRQILLGANPMPEKIEQIDGLFREQGYLLPENVI